MESPKIREYPPIKGLLIVCPKCDEELEIVLDANGFIKKVCSHGKFRKVK